MVVQQRGLGENSLNTAIQLIFREWLEMQEEIPQGSSSSGFSNNLK
jgi:hypothetical protein